MFQMIVIVYLCTNMVESICMYENVYSPHSDIFKHSSTNQVLKDNARTLYYFHPVFDNTQNVVYMNSGFNDTPQTKYDNAMSILETPDDYSKDFLKKVASLVVESAFEKYTPAIDYLLYTCSVPTEDFIKQENKQYLIKKILKAIKRKPD